ncbi:MAG: hypothetical protein ACXVKA_07865 [Acidimicrobiia bacterium]
MAPSASAVKPTITATTGNVSCQITGKVKLHPGLKNNWVQADHQTDPNAAVRAIPNTTIAQNGPISTTGKVKSVSCTGSASNGTVTAPVTKAKVTLSVDPLHPGSTNPATCTALLTNVPPNTAKYVLSVQWTATGAKLVNTTITGAGIAPSGLGFAVTGGTVTGSFATGSSTAQVNVDGATILAVTAPAPSSTATDTGPCHARLKLKGATATKPASARLIPAKGLKKIGVVAGSTFHVQNP